MAAAKSAMLLCAPPRAPPPLTVRRQQLRLRVDALTPVDEAPARMRLDGELTPVDQADPSEEILLPMEPGDGLFFTNYTWHRSEPNCSGRTSAFYAIAYQVRDRAASQ